MCGPRRDAARTGCGAGRGCRAGSKTVCTVGRTVETQVVIAPQSRTRGLVPWPFRRVAKRRRSAACIVRTTRSRSPRCRSTRSPVKPTCVIASPRTVFIAANASSKSRPKARQKNKSRSGVLELRAVQMASIAVDVMSGDSGAPECIPGVLRALAADPALEIILVGKPEIIEPVLAAAPATLRARASVHPAASVVGMSEHPREAIRRRKDSSMRLAIDLVKDGRAGAMVSAGNTGALTAMAHFVLKTVGPVERAPIMSSVPARNGGHTHILDLGANSSATALQLAQFATMGSIVARDVFGIANPRVGLLNIGEEESKGHELVQEAHELIRASGVNYL